MRSTVILFALAILAATAAADAKPAKGLQSMSTSDLKRARGFYNEDCRPGVRSKRGGCVMRDSIDRELGRRGICWTYSDPRVPGYMKGWHSCSQTTPTGWRPR